MSEVPPNRVEVRFAVDKQPVTCDQFSLKLDQGSKNVMDGNFSTAFNLPAGEPKSPEPPLTITIGCAGYIWHFDRVPTAVMQHGWWFIGTDYPPFQSEFSCPKFAKYRLIRYLQFVRNDGEGFNYYETVPRSPTNNEGCGA